MKSIVLYSCLMLGAIDIFPCASDFYATQNDYTKVTLHWTNNSCGVGDHLRFSIIDAEQNVQGVYTFAPLGTEGQLEIGNFFLNAENRVDVFWIENASELLQRWSFASLAAPPSDSWSIPFQNVQSRSITVAWWSTGVSGQINPIGTNYQIQFSEKAGFDEPLVESISSEYGNLIAKKIGCLSPGTLYYARVRALNREGIPTPFHVLGSTRTLSDSPPQTNYLWGNNRWELSLSPLDISSEDTMTFNAAPLENPLQSPTLPEKILDANHKILGTGDVRRRPLPNGLAEIQSSRACPAHLDENLHAPATLSYDFASNDGWVETGAGLVRETTLSFYRLDFHAGLWNKIPSRVEDGKVVAIVQSLGTLSVMGQEDVSLQDLRVSPNPFRQGTDAQVTFANLAERATLRIFTASGREVRQLEETGGDGILCWDGKNTSGRPVVPGVYLYHVQSPGVAKKGKLMVIR
ncbi:MAG: hypothetical protein JNK54_06890 [Elusimicrobia bacterium]|nr:hypothetical protein [Elusimicrobiota bacterium]